MLDAGFDHVPAALAVGSLEADAHGNAR